MEFRAVSVGSPSLLGARVRGLAAQTLRAGSANVLSGGIEARFTGFALPNISTPNTFSTNSEAQPV